MKAKLYLLLAGTLLGSSVLISAQPVITNQPQHQGIIKGGVATFQVGATGTEPLNYQWQQAFDYMNYANRLGATNYNLVITNVQVSDAANYRVIITNLQGAVTSSAAQLTVWLPPTISGSGQPTNFPCMSLGTSVTNRVLAGGTTPLRYQWRHDGVDMPGKTAPILVLSNLVAADSGLYDVVITNMVGSVTSSVAVLNVNPIFIKIISGPVVTDTGGWQAPNWWDYDNDGFLDLLVPRGGSSSTAQSALYHNNRDGTFNRITTNAIALRAISSVGAAVGDYNNDGNADLFLNHYSTAEDLFRNDGGGKFTSLTAAQAGPLISDVDKSADVALADYDRDGFLDVFTPNAYWFYAAASDCLYHNEGELPFSKVSASQVGPLVADNARTGPCAWVDYDNDGWPDLWIGTAWSQSPSTGEHYIWHSERDGTFSLVTEQLGSLSNNVAMSVGLWADYDNDGFQDLFLPGWDATNTLHRNLAGQLFEEVSRQANVAARHYSAAAAWGDYDNDGYLDLIVLGYRAPTNQCFLYRNNGDGTFTSVEAGNVLYDGTRRIGVAWADYDNDGFLDLLIACGDGNSAGQNQLYRNAGNSNAWMKVRLDGRASNRSAIGAKIRIKATIHGRAFWQMRELSGNSGTCGGAGGLVSHFGLGDATNVTTVRIEWPSGIVQELHNVAANQLLTVVESQGYTNAPPQFSGAAKTAGGVELSFTEPAAGARYLLEASSNLVTWTKLLARTSAGGSYQFTDLNGTNYPRRFYRLQVP